ncbi:aldehyde dehydrogenase [Vibrio variabilis]|uniref:Aldehyde dehydrogenase n=1 Tax=Vibrio variabilis TaxID=990271 RepID=A0ABQ0JAH5_9VIBR|nr:aldehyde dehydrogenase [Vibrio variabilis]
MSSRGEADIAACFTSLPFDHLLFTGSTGVGRMVMKSAAENLTPLTLELGGKSPVIVADDVDIEMAVERIIYGKSSIMDKFASHQIMCCFQRAKSKRS